MRRSITSLPLHYGKAPMWLFSRMKRFSAAIAEIVVFEFGPSALLARLADPVWFQALGCAAGFDWHSSGVTTTLCGALKEGIAALGEDFPVAICGGKAKRAMETPREIGRYEDRWGVDTAGHVHMSRLCAKIDNAALQDGYNLYHHTYLFTRDGEWAIVQQGMNEETGTARRYQWLSSDDLVVTCEPHSGITCNTLGETMNFVARESRGAQDAVLSFSKEDPSVMMKAWERVHLHMPRRHRIMPSDVNVARLSKAFVALHESQPKDFAEVMGVKGVGPRTMEALALVAELVYDMPPSFKDPARFSFAHGGKDGHPFPVDRPAYDKSVEFLQACIDGAKLGDRDKLDALKRLKGFAR